MLEKLAMILLIGFKQHIISIEEIRLQLELNKEYFNKKNMMFLETEDFHYYKATLQKIS